MHWVYKAHWTPVVLTSILLLLAGQQVNGVHAANPVEEGNKVVSFSVCREELSKERRSWPIPCVLSALPRRCRCAIVRTAHLNGALAYGLR